MSTVLFLFTGHAGDTSSDQETEFYTLHRCASMLSTPTPCYQRLAVFVSLRLFPPFSVATGSFGGLAPCSSVCSYLNAKITAIKHEKAKKNGFLMEANL